MAHSTQHDHRTTTRGISFTTVGCNRSGVAEASTLGLAPGMWPERLHITSHKTQATQTFFRTHKLPQGGYNYHKDGINIAVLND